MIIIIEHLKSYKMNAILRISQTSLTVHNGMYEMYGISLGHFPMYIGFCYFRTRDELISMQSNSYGTIWNLNNMTSRVQTLTSHAKRSSIWFT